MDETKYEGIPSTQGIPLTKFGEIRNEIIKIVLDDESTQETVKKAQEWIDTTIQKYKDKGYLETEINTSITHAINVYKDSNYNQIFNKVYASVCTEHSKMYWNDSYVGPHRISLLNSDYTKERNEKGQKIVDAVLSYQKEKRDEELIQNLRRTIDRYESLVETLQNKYDIPDEDVKL